MSWKFCRDVPDPWGCSKHLCKKSSCAFFVPYTLFGLFPGVRACSMRKAMSHSVLRLLFLGTLKGFWGVPKRQFHPLITQSKNAEHGLLILCLVDWYRFHAYTWGRSPREVRILRLVKRTTTRIIAAIADMRSALSGRADKADLSRLIKTMMKKTKDKKNNKMKGRKKHSKRHHKKE